MKRLARGALLAAAFVGAGCRASGDRPGVVFLPDMYRSVPYDAYDPNTVTPAGQTLLLPPEGSVPLGRAPFPYGPGPEEAQRAGAQLTNAMPATPMNLARGKKVYETTCIVCHGPRGQGDGPIIGRFPNPPSLLAERARTLPDGRIYHIITRGQGIMPSHALQVLPADRWRVVHYLRQLQTEAAAPPAVAATTTAGAAAPSGGNP